MKVQGSRAPRVSAHLPEDWVGAGVILAREKGRSTTQPQGASLQGRRASGSAPTNNAVFDGVQLFVNPELDPEIGTELEFTPTVLPSRRGTVARAPVTTSRQTHGL